MVQRFKSFVGSIINPLIDELIIDGHKINLYEKKNLMGSAHGTPHNSLLQTGCYNRNSSNIAHYMGSINIALILKNSTNIIFMDIKSRMMAERPFEYRAVLTAELKKSTNHRTRKILERNIETIDRLISRAWLKTGQTLNKK